MVRDALLLAAGLGTRLRPLTDVRAKPAIPVGGTPLIRRILAWLAASDIRDIVVNLHHRPHTLTAILGDGHDLGVKVRYSWEQPRVLGSAGGPRLALPIVGADTFFVVNGDTLANVDLAEMAREHASSGALVTLAVVHNRHHERYGGVLADGDGRVTGFVGRGPGAAGSWHFIGVQLVHASVFAALKAGVPTSSIGGVYDDVIRTRPEAIRAFRCTAEFWDVGTPEDYWLTSEAFGEAPAGARSTIDRSARVTRSIVWDDVSVGADARIEECILTDGVRVREGAEYRRRILVRRDRDGIEATPLAIG